MCKVIDLEEHFPHLVIETDNAVHVIPLSNFLKITNGEINFSKMYDSDSIAKTIISDWLKTKGITNGR